MSGGRHHTQFSFTNYCYYVFLIGDCNANEIAHRDRVNADNLHRAYIVYLGHVALFKWQACENEKTINKNIVRRWKAYPE